MCFECFSCVLCLTWFAKLQVTCCKDKAVQVSVYVETSRKKRPSANEHHRHCRHHDNIHHTYRREAVNGGAAARNKGYDRRAELLKYSQSLRESGQTAPSTPLLAEQISNNNSQPTTQPVSLLTTMIYAKDTSCCFQRYILLLSF